MCWEKRGKAIETVPYIARGAVDTGEAEEVPAMQS